MKNIMRISAITAALIAAVSAISIRLVKSCIDVSSLAFGEDSIL